MKIIKPSVEILTPIDEEQVLKHLEIMARTCYQSEGTGDSGKFIKKLIKSGHESVIEHYSVTVKFIVDRGVSHELVRHRLASFSQESTRYCNYTNNKFGNEITVIEPLFFEYGTPAYEAWKTSCEGAENAYFYLVHNLGITAEKARTILPNSLKTEVVMTANLRTWRHFLKLRASGIHGIPHPQMLQVTIPLLKDFKEKLPTIFFDIQGD